MNDTSIHINDCDIIKCSNCDKKLMIISPQDKQQQTLYTLQVSCPFCGDHSYDYEVKGLLRYTFSEGIKFKAHEEKNGKVKFLTTR